MKYKINEILSDGYVMGEALKLIKENNESTKFVSKNIEIVKLNHSIQRTSNELIDMKHKNPDLADYLETERLIAVDPILRKGVTDKIEQDGLSAEAAVETVMDVYIHNLLNSKSNYLRERANDISDVTDRLIRNMSQKNDFSDDDRYILVTDVLYPSLLIQRRKSLVGVIAKRGGYTSHSAILCRSFEIPYVIADIDCESDDTIIIDTRFNEIDVNPSKKDEDLFNGENSKRIFTSKTAIAHDPEFEFLANVSNSFEVLKANEYNFDAIGLYRTEMLFMNADLPYTFLEQYSIYSEAVKMMKGKPITFRTFDVGDDKIIKYLQSDKKGINNYIMNPEIFEAQVSALMKANTNNSVKIMFPMIYSNSEFEYLRDWVIKIARRNEYSVPSIGMMLETKEALEHITDFIKTDFISIGTNDLTMELYGINREDFSDVSKYVDNLIELLKPVVEFANKSGKPLSVCGEIASIKDVALKFYEIGIKRLSVSPPLITILNMSYSEYKNKK
ncbi:MAG: phosphoenolpyruvate--protein phosphotransferase [Acholeplasmatales bacterium]|nr:phosphoenolpyruvate--protein phosphotransferase [Acholeplasmatales bacterium]